MEVKETEEHKLEYQDNMKENCDEDTKESQGDG